MNFKVYRSSAGSGKTTTLVKEFLRLTLPQPDNFRRILGITFTNKAANEMRERIIEDLSILSKPEKYPDSRVITSLLPYFIKTTGLSREEIIKNAELILQKILHNYSEFAFCTIDSFMHRIIRTFAHDLSIPVNFEVELDADSLLSQTIDLLMDKAGIDDDITNILLEFIISKTEDDKSWRIENELIQTAKILLNEDEQNHLQNLRSIGIPQFFKIRKNLAEWNAKYENSIFSLAAEAIKIIKENGISIDSFYYGRQGIGNWFEQKSKSLAGINSMEEFKGNSRVLTTVEQNLWYKKTEELNIKQKIDNISTQLKDLYHRIIYLAEDGFSKYKMFSSILANLFAMALLNEIKKIMDEYKNLSNIVHISEFNQRISQIILKEPVPFIYERTGEKYKHLMIDEFQDTSILQWMNLLPLFENSLAENNFNLIVGDGKQAIYRFRNGEVEQFLNLPQINNPNSNEQLSFREKILTENFSEDTLNTNFRSQEVIVNFNNLLFENLKKYLSGNLQAIYQNHLQQVSKPGGYVRVEFIANEKENETNYKELTKTKVLETILSMQEEEICLNDITILCRANAEASEIATFLLNNDIQVITSESLLLKNSQEVSFLIAFLKIIINSTDEISYTEIIIFLHKQTGLDVELHTLLSHIKNKSNEDFITFLSVFGFNIHLNKFKNLPLYDLCEEICRNFNLVNPTKSNPFIRFFLDFVFNYSTRFNSNVGGFLDVWEEKKSSLSIIVPDGIEAVKIITIHKAKGLQFPVVIYPFADAGLKLTKSKSWINLSYPELEELRDVLVSTTSLQGTDFSQIYEIENQKSMLDLLNVLYVALTRPINRLYVFSKDVKMDSKNEKINIAAFLKEFLKSTDFWKENELSYDFGERTDIGSIKTKFKDEDKHTSWISTFWREHILISFRAPELWDFDKPKEKLNWGNLVHSIMADIQTEKDVQSAINKIKSLYNLNIAESDKIRAEVESIVNHELLYPYFSENCIIKNESEILLPNGSTYRPDKVVIIKGEAVIIDYKTGKPSENHKNQIRLYGDLISKLGYNVLKLLLVYTGETVIVTEVD